MGGMMPYHSFPLDETESGDKICTLNWLPKALCEAMIGRFIHKAIENSDELNWMVDAASWDNNMLAVLEINEICIPRDHMSRFGDRIIRLMKQVDNWCEYTPFED